MGSYIFHTLSRSIYYNRARPKNLKYRKKMPYSWYFTSSKNSKISNFTIKKLPKSIGIIIRPYDLKYENKNIKKIINQAKNKSLISLVAGITYKAPNTDGVHIPRWMYYKPKKTKIVSISFHGLKDTRKCLNLRANLVFVSPIFKTSSHVCSKGIGVVKLGLISRSIKVPVIALGGINDKNIKYLRSLPIYGCAGIDVFDKNVKK